MHKVSQPMAASGSSPFASGVPAQVKAAYPLEAGIRGSDELPISSLLDKQERVGKAVSFVIPQSPRGKSRHATVVTLRCGKCQRQTVGQRTECPHCHSVGQMYFMCSREFTPKDQVEFERFCAMCGQQGMLNTEKFTGPVSVRCDFWFGIPKTRIKKLKDGDWHTQKPDLDNCIKSVWDGGLNQVCIADDCTVSQVTGYKRWTSGIPRIEVSIESLDMVTTNGA